MPPAKQSKLSSKLQVSVPASIARAAGLAAGDRVSIKAERDGSIRIRSCAAMLKSVSVGVNIPEHLKGASIKDLKKAAAAGWIERFARLDANDHLRNSKGSTDANHIIRK